jgi:hypothetical protein
MPLPSITLQGEAASALCPNDTRVSHCAYRRNVQHDHHGGTKCFSLRATRGRAARARCVGREHEHLLEKRWHAAPTLVRCAKDPLRRWHGSAGPAERSGAWRSTGRACAATERLHHTRSKAGALVTLGAESPQHRPSNLAETPWPRQAPRATRATRALARRARRGASEGSSDFERIIGHQIREAREHQIRMKQLRDRLGSNRDVLPWRTLAPRLEHTGPFDHAAAS